MESKAIYKTETDCTKLPATLCKCGMQLGYEVLVIWPHHRRGMIESKYFVRTIMGQPVAKIFVRGEILCKCGERLVWNA